MIKIKKETFNNVDLVKSAFIIGRDIITMVDAVCAGLFCPLRRFIFCC